jgi:pentatricopeptide repeat domain-containing protein 1
MSVEEAVLLIKRLPRLDPLPDRLFRALHLFDSRAVALLLKDLSKAQLDARAIELFDRLRAVPERHPLRSLCDVFTYTAMISLCVYQVNVDRAMELLQEMQSRNVERNVHTYTALMNVCIKCGKLPTALEIFQSMKAEGCTPNVVTYNTLIDVFGKLGQWERAVNVLSLMRSEVRVGRCNWALMISLVGRCNWALMISRWQ